MLDLKVGGANTENSKVDSPNVTPIRSATRKIDGEEYQTSIYKIGDLGTLAKADIANGSYVLIGQGVSFAALKAVLAMFDQIGGKFTFSGEITRQRRPNGSYAYSASGKLAVEGTNKTFVGRVSLNGYYDNSKTLQPATEQFAELFTQFKEGIEVPVLVAYQSNLPNGAPYIPAHILVG
jgi:hypothetical protein